MSFRAPWLWPAILAVVSLSANAQINRDTTHLSSSPQAAPRAMAKFLTRPLSFEPNHGQADAAAKFLARGSSYNLFLMPDGAVLELKTGDANASAIRMTFAGANRKAEGAGLEVLPGRSNYFIGNDSKNWRGNIPNFERVRFAGVYPGVDVVYYGNQRQLEYDFVVAPGADPSRIRMSFEGAQVGLDKSGELVLTTDSGEVRLKRPRIYQEESGKQTEVAGGYVLRGHDGAAFQIARYDRSKPLFIDPVVTNWNLTYATYLGGSSDDFGVGIATDVNGNAYITGATLSMNFPGVGTSSFQQTCKSCVNGNHNIFVTELSSTGTPLFSTYIGGSGDDWPASNTNSSPGISLNTPLGGGIFVDSGFNVFLTGGTSSSDFPTTSGAYEASCSAACANGNPVPFVLKLNAGGSTLGFSTYLTGTSGGFNEQGGSGIVADSSGVYVAGYTSDSSFPTTAGVVQPTNKTTFNDTGFVTKLNASGSALVYSTFLGGSAQDVVRGIGLDSGGNVYVAGSTVSLDFPAVTTLGLTPPPGLSRSTSSGASWTYQSNGPTPAMPADDVRAVAVNPIDSSILAATRLHGVYRSTDSGNTWAASTGIPSFTNVRGFGFNPTSASKVLAGTNGNGVYLSTNGGLTWAASNTNFTGGDVRSIVFDPASPTHVFATDRNNGSSSGGVWESTDSGATWSLIAFSGQGVSSVALDPTNDLTLYAAVRKTGVEKSTDGGATWALKLSNVGQDQPVLLVDPNNHLKVFFADVSVLWTTTDGGSSWITRVPGPVGLGGIAVDPTNSNNVYAASVVNGIYKSTDGGITFALNNSGLNSIATFDVALDPRNPANLYAGTNYQHGFVTKLNSTATAMTYSTLLGGNGIDEADRITVDSSGEAILTGLTSSPIFFTTSGAAQKTYAGGGFDGFVTKVNSSGNGAVFSTYLGGSGLDRTLGSAIDTSGNVYVTGFTNSTDLTMVNPLGPALGQGTPQDCFAVNFFPGPCDDAFVFQYSSSGTLLFSTYLGGPKQDYGTDIAVDGNGNIYVTGTTFGQFPTLSAFQSTSGGSLDAFVAKIAPNNAPSAPDLKLTLSHSPNPVTTGGVANFTATINNAGTAPATGVTLGFGNSLLGLLGVTLNSVVASPSGSCQTVNAGEMVCSLGSIAIGGTTTVTFSTSAISTAVTWNSTASVSAVESDATPADNNATDLLTVSSTTGPVVSLAPPSLQFGDQLIGTSSASQTVTLTNTGSATLTISSVSVTGANAADFPLTNSCPSSLAANASCTLTITFKPSLAGSESASLMISDNAPGSPQSVSLSGSGVTLLPNEFTISTFAGGPVPTGVAALGAGIGRVHGLTKDAGGNIYIASVQNVIYKMDTKGTLTVVAGNGIQGYNGDNIPATTAELSFPYDVAVDGSGNVFIADSSNCRIRRVDAASGNISTYAGNGTCGYTGDNGPATAAQINTINGLSFVALDASGNLFIADEGNGVVRRVDAATKTITTYAGNNAQSGGFCGNGGPATAACFGDVRGLRIDNGGNLLIADAFNAVVWQVNATTQNIAIIVGNGSTGSCAPGSPALSCGVINVEALYMDAAGNLFLSQHRGNGTVYEIAASTQTASIFAGGNGAGFSGDGGPATAAQLNQNSGVVGDAAGNIYIADNYNSRVRKVNTSGNINTVAGGGTNGDGGPALAAEINNPLGMAVDSSGRLVFGDAQHSVIRRIDTAGNISTIIGNGIGAFAGDGGPATSAEISSAFALAMDTSGNVFFTDGGRRIRRMDAVALTVSTVAGSATVGFSGDNGPATSATLNSPQGVAVDGAGNLYIADAQNSVIRFVNASTQVITTIAGAAGSFGFSGDGGPASSAVLNFPTDLKVDTAGNLYFVDSGNNRIRRIDHTSLAISTVAGNGNSASSGDGGPATSAGMSPNSLLVDPAGNIFISDFATNTIRRVDATTGVITTSAGNGTIGYSGDGGLATKAQLNGPASIAIDAGGNLYFGDQGARIRKLGPIPNAPDMSLSLSVSPSAPISVLGTATITASVTNTGTVAGTATVTHTIPPGLQFVSASPACSGATVITCVLGNVNPSSTVTGSITVQAVQLGSLVDSATVTPSDSTPSDNSATATVVVSGNNPVPAITSFTVSTSDVVTVSGSNFVSGATVTWDGSGRTTTYISPTVVQAQLLSSDLSPTTHSLGVNNPGPGGGSSNVLTVPVDAGNYSIQTLQPFVANGGGPGFSMTVSGSGFVPGLVVEWNGVAKPTSFVSGTQLQASISAADLAIPGMAQVTVANPTNGQTSNAVTLPVADFKPTASPAALTIARGQSGTLTLNLASVFGAFNGSVTLACPNLPQGMSCAFSPASLTPGASGASSALTISVSQNAVARAPFPKHPRAYYAFWIAGFPLFGVVLISARRRKLWLGLGLIVVLAVIMIACGGGGSNMTTPPPSAPSATGTVTVSATSGGLAHSVTVPVTIR